MPIWMKPFRILPVIFIRPVRREKKLIDRIFDSMERLDEFPLIGSVADNDILNAKGYRLLPVDNFIVFYIPKGEEVHIVRIIYGRRDWETILLGKN